MTVVVKALWDKGNKLPQHLLFTVSHSFSKRELNAYLVSSTVQETVLL